LKTANLAEPNDELAAGVRCTSLNTCQPWEPGAKKTLRSDPKNDREFKTESSWQAANLPGTSRRYHEKMYLICLNDTARSIFYHDLSRK